MVSNRRTNMLLRVAALILATLCSTMAQQSPPQLQITSPAAGTIVNPGQTISVSVLSPAGTSFSKVAVAGQDPLGSSGFATSVPSQFSISVPTNISPGTYMLTALGTTTAGKFVQSATILLDVERPDMPASISADPPQVLFRSAGQHAPLEILATFPDGAVLEVTGSSHLLYSSSNNAVATVDKNGIVSAVGKGSASITATYTQGTQSVQVSVPVTVPSPVLTSSPASLNFNSQDVGTSSPAQTLTVTNVSNNQGLKVGPVSSTGDFFETDNCATSSPIAVGGMCTINVAFRPTATGSRTGTVNVADSVDIVPVAIPLTGTGVPPPSVTSLNPTSGPVGTSVTITGASFGATQGTSTVTFGATAATPNSWSATSIVVPVPGHAPKANTIVAVVVKVGVASNGVNFTICSKSSTC
jgi:IPT/TIG domain-containing protein/Big-like domain-containing protein